VFSIGRRECADESVQDLEFIGMGVVRDSRQDCELGPFTGEVGIGNDR